MLSYTGNKHKESRLLESLGVESSLGTVPWPLPNMRRTDESEFWGHHSSMGNNWMSAYIGSKQVENAKGALKWATLHVFFDDTMSNRSAGYCVATLHAEYVGQYPDGKYVNEVAYFWWGKCVHEFKEKNIGRCLHRYDCQKCGDSYEVDSSG
jgi:hypothetical protein